MSGVYGFSRDAVRIKVKKCEGVSQPDFRKFSVDPQITTFEVLQSILTKAFDIKADFSISYRLYDIYGNETYMPLLSDWELDAAFLKAHNLSLACSSEPSLCLRVDTKPLEEVSDDWEARGNVPVITQLRTSNAQEVKPAPRLHGLINQMGKTFNMVQRVLNFGDDPNASIQPPRPPLSDSEFRKFLDPVGQIIHARELRSAIYFGGIDPSLRKVVWKHILNVYPSGMCGKERMDYIKNKASEYIELRETWKAAMSSGPVVGELAYATGMVKKDVLRTDRHHRFYAGSDDNRNIESLYNILTTYALNHPKVSYCQGMSDLASPLLVTMGDEAHAYICFCALMMRLCTNFMLDGIAMTQRFTHLAEGLLFYDPEFYNYLKSHQADDLLFCYRWLLLEMKREFAFDDSLRMLEVLWSSIPAEPPDKELRLYDTKFQPAQLAQPPPIKTPRENAYTKVCALRRQSSSISLVNYSCTTKKASSQVKRQNHSLDETIGRSKNSISETKTKHQSLDDNATTFQKSPVSPKSDEVRPRSISPLEINDSIALNNRNNRKSSSMTNLIKNKKPGHFKDLKERIVSSLDRLDASNHSILEESEDSVPKGKVVKNLNEFLHFASSVNKSKISDKLIRFNSVSEEKPKIMLTKSSFDDSESSGCGGRHLSSTSNSCDSFDDYSPDDSQEYFPLTTSATRELKLELENLEKTVKTTPKPGHTERLATKDSVFVWENPLHKSNIPNHIRTPDEQADLEYDSHSAVEVKNKEVDDSCEEVSEEASRAPGMLPPPDDFGGGNPFLMFLCITVLLQHRDGIMDTAMDYNEMAMHFDKMVRKHNVNKVLNQARQMYAGYLKQHKMAQQNVST